MITLNLVHWQAHLQAHPVITYTVIHDITHIFHLLKAEVRQVCTCSDIGTCSN